MMNDESVRETRKINKIQYIELDQLESNAHNHYKINDIAELAENISENGLFQPVIVFERNDKYVIHTGHRRCAALKKLFDENKQATFLNRELNDEIPCIVVKEIGDSLKERISLMATNSQRQFSKEEKTEIVKEAYNLYKELVEAQGKKIGRSREWISSLTGFTLNSVKEILVVLNKGDEAEENEAVPSQDKQAIETEADKIIKTLNKLSKQIEKLDQQDAENVKDALMDILHNL